MELSSKVEYAMVSLLEMASRPHADKPLQIKQIADKHRIPERYLEQVFSLLRRSGIIQSQRGSKGGYFLAREAWQITLLDILLCLEDPNSAKGVQAHKPLDRSLIYEIWTEAQQSARDVLRRYTLRDLCQQMELRQQLNTMYYI